MRKRKRSLLTGLAAVTISVVTSTSASAAPGITPFATGLNGPFGVDYQYGKVYVAEQETGNILSVNPDNGQQRVELTGFSQPADVARVDRKLVVVTSGSEVPDASLQGDASVFTAEPGQTPKLLADLDAYERANNTDGQTLFDPETGEALDSISNPFAVIRDKRPGGYVLVADAGANAVFAINPQGVIKPFFLPPLINTGACEGAPNNDAEHVGCDPVPTDLSYGPDGYLYVSTLTSLVPGEGRVYVLDAYTGAVKRVISGLDGPTGVVADNKGSVYVSEVTCGAPEGEGPPPEGFDPSQVGRIVKIDKFGVQTQADVPMPVGLAINTYDNTLYATAWSVAGLFLGIPDAGQLVKVPQSAFHPIAAPV